MTDFITRLYPSRLSHLVITHFRAQLSGDVES